MLAPFTILSFFAMAFKIILFFQRQNQEKIYVWAGETGFYLSYPQQL